MHRSLFADAKNLANTPRHDVADHLSSSERNSAAAERDSKDVKLHAYLLDQIHSGKPVSYLARITSLRDFGFFVDIAGLGMSGVVLRTLLENDHYRHDAVAKHIEGRDKRRTIRLGDTIQMEIAKVDAARKMVDFRITVTIHSSGRPSLGRRSGARSRSGNHKPVTAVKDTADNTPKAAGEGAARRRCSGRRRGKAKAA